ncbi:MAG: nucleoid occlusion factor SlmA [Burkholderiales bacterium]|nr:nucleoid occlusion factor SlmA [Burkholderiales bacterium]
MPARRRGERKLQILQVLARMLEDPAGERITTATLAAKLDVSEAALYRHFASKAQMYEGLIEFIESSIFGVANRIASEEENGLKQLHALLSLLLSFAEKNPGMTRVLIGDALVHENPRLQARINQVHERIEATLRQCLRVASTQGHEEPEPAARASLLMCWVTGRWHQYAKGGFKRLPTEGWEKVWPILI